MLSRDKLDKMERASEIFINIGRKGEKERDIERERERVGCGTSIPLRNNEKSTNQPTDGQTG